MVTRFLTAVVVSLVSFAGVSLAQADWIAGRDLHADITATAGSPTNPNGTVPQWSYGTESTLGGTFSTTAYTFTNMLAGDSNLQGWQSATTGDVPDATVNVSSGPITPVFAPSDAPQIPPDVMFVHPGTGGLAFSVVQWTAPTAGVYLVAAQWQTLSSAAAGVEAALLRDNNGGSPLADVKYLSGSSPSSSYSNTLTLAAGETLQFLVGPNGVGSNGSDHTMFDAEIQRVVPEPASIVLGGIATVGLLVAGRRRKA